MSKTDIDKIFDFILEADKEKLITRQTYLSNGEKKENDAEHAWHMALMTVLLGDLSDSKLDVLKTVTMLLIHDLVEIDAGDTYCYDAQAVTTQSERERRAADRIFGLLPEAQGQRLRALWEEFEEWQTPEARFAHTMDNIQPAMLNHASGGKSWAEHSVRLSQILGRNKRTAEGSQALWSYSLNNFILPHVKEGEIQNDTDIDI